MTRREKPLNKIVMTAGKLRLYVEHGDIALDGQTPQEFAADVQECMSHLMEFRNLVNAMAALDEAPADAVSQYI